MTREVEADPAFTRALLLVCEARRLRLRGLREGSRGRIALEQVADLRARHAMALVLEGAS